MAVVLVAVGALLYVRLGDAIDEQLDESLQLRAQALAGGGALETGDDEAVAQRLGPDGSPTASSPGLDAALVTREEAARAQDGSFFLTREVDGEPMRLLVTPGSPRRRSVARGPATRRSTSCSPSSSSSARSRCSSRPPPATSLATAALRPVEAMRREAAEISGDAAGRRLPLRARA